MSIISSDLGGRSVLDYALIGIAGAVVVAFLGLGLYGSSTGFLQTVAYYKANDVVSLACAAIAAGCALYLMIELLEAPKPRALLGVAVICGMFGFFAVSKGVPAAVTMAYGKPGQVNFTIARFDWMSGRGCNSTVVATNAGYEDFRQCDRYFDGRPLRVGQTIEVTGTISAWGIARETYRVRR